MDGISLLQEARAAGLMVSMEGDRLIIRGPRQAEPIAKKLIAYKPVVVQALHAANLPEPPPGALPMDLPAAWHFLWDERAAIMEYDGGMAKEHAEVAALKDILQAMQRAGTVVSK